MEVCRCTVPSAGIVRFRFDGFAQDHLSPQGHPNGWLQHRQHDAACQIPPAGKTIVTVCGVGIS